jgi:hypothetical protein
MYVNMNRSPCDSPVNVIYEGKELLLPFFF